MMQPIHYGVCFTRVGDSVKPYRFGSYMSWIVLRLPEGRIVYVEVRR